MIQAYFDNLTSSTKGDVGDWQHAARLYIDANMRLAPKVKYLYHIVLNINPGADISALGNNQKYEINLLAKSSELPKYRIDTVTVNQYNRKKVLQTGVEYQPLTIEFHDDNSGLTTLLWESYFRYYYADSEYTKKIGNSPSITTDAYRRIEQGKNRVYGESGQNTFRYGLDKSGKVEPFFSSVQIFQLHPQNGKSTFTAFTLINPIIVSFEHDQMDHSMSEFVLNRVTLQYESVQYARGYTEPGNNPTGFAGDRLYDSVESSLQLNNTSVSTTNTITGQNNSETAFKRKNQDSNIALSTIENQRQGQLKTTNTQTSPAIQSTGGYSFPQSSAQAETTPATQSNIVPPTTTSNSNRFSIKGYTNSAAETTDQWKNLYQEELQGMPGYPDNVKRSLRTAAKNRAHALYKAGLGNGTISPPPGVEVIPAN